MRSQSLDLAKYATDKIQHGYLKMYDPVFSELVDQEINLLELGVLEGGSLLLWRDYFPKGHVVGVDYKAPAALNGEERICVFSGEQQDTQTLDKAAAEAPGGFDIIIDDASHIGAITKASFWYLFEKYLKPGGIYAVEDWGTGYWEDWADGRAYSSHGGIEAKYYDVVRRIGLIKGAFLYSHSFGMVGFIKQLVDEQGAGALLRRKWNDGLAARRSKFQSILITETIVFVRKKGGDDG